MRNPRRTLLLAAAPAVALLVAASAVLLLVLDRSESHTGVTGGEQLLAFAEFGPASDQVFVAPASNPTARRLVAAIDHVEGWGINPAFSIAGSRAAYTVLPVGSIPRRDTRAELWLLDMKTGERTRLARDADLLATPAFDLGGRQLVYRSTRPDGRQEIVRVDLDTHVRRVVHAYEGPFGVYPVGFASDGAIVFASLSTKGTEVHRVREGEASTVIAHASDQIARDWRISPDGKELSYIAPELHSERWIYRAQVISIADGRTRSLDPTPVVTAEQYGPVWTPDGRGVTLGLEPYQQSAASAFTVSLDDGSARALARPAVGFDVPLAWSPNGQYLVARSFDGVSSYQPGRESVVVISESGERFPLSTGAEIIFLGWVASG